MSGDVGNTFLAVFLDIQTHPPVLRASCQGPRQGCLRAAISLLVTFRPGLGIILHASTSGAALVSLMLSNERQLVGN